MKPLFRRAARSPIRGERSILLQPRLGACLALGAALCTASTASSAPPVANSDTYTTTFDQGLVVPAGEGLLVNDSDPDGDAIFVIPPGSMFGVGGTDPGQFLLPQGIALDDAGNIYATNAFTPRAEKFDANGNHLSSFDIQGGIGIAVEDSGNVLISKGNLIYRFAPGGPLLETFGDQHLSDAWGMTLDADGTCTAARVGLGAVAATVLRVDAAADALIGTKVDEVAIEAAAAACSAAASPIDDKRGTVAFRTHVAGVLTRRAALIARQRAEAK